MLLQSFDSCFLVATALTSCCKQMHHVLAAKDIMGAEFHWDQLIKALGAGDGLSKAEVSNL